MSEMRLYTRQGRRRTISQKESSIIRQYLWQFSKSHGYG
jgi:hypothetical protein